MCSEIDRSQSCIPIGSIGLCDTVHVGKMALADDIDLLVSRRPGLTELALAKFLFGRMGYQQLVNSTCRHLFRQGHVERHGTGGPGDPFTYYPALVLSSQPDSRGQRKGTLLATRTPNDPGSADMPPRLSPIHEGRG
jgi:hypothetical protein